MVYTATRKPVVSGTFYSDNKEKLIAQIEASFKHKLGPGKLPNKTKDKPKYVAAIVPHAGYLYSGPCAAHAFKALAEAEKPDAVILLGPSHTGLGRISVWNGADWETPMGIAKIDQELASEILNRSELSDTKKNSTNSLGAQKSQIFDTELFAHLREHSLEVQVPFLQYIYGDDIKILPIVIAPEPSLMLCKQIGSALAQAVKDSGKKVVMLTSSDFTHYGVSYGYLPFFGGDVRAKIEALDKGAIKEIIALQLEKYIDYVRQTKATICGRTAIGTLIAYAYATGIRTGELLKYYTSGDITGSHMNSVSYASILF